MSINDSRSPNTETPLEGGGKRMARLTFSTASAASPWHRRSRRHTALGRCHPPPGSDTPGSPARACARSANPATARRGRWPPDAPRRGCRGRPRTGLPPLRSPRRDSWRPGALPGRSGAGTAARSRRRCSERPAWRPRRPRRP
eukprot:scaffold535_cov260-Pinguiococcus_pyrenoidosus.AAC.15